MRFHDLIGAPYKLGGRGPSEFDCAGLAIEMQKRQGYLIPQVGSPTEEAAQLSSMLRVLRTSWRELDAPQAGCLVFFPGEGHVGTMLDARRFFHTTSDMGDAHICSLSHPLWRTRRRAFYVPATGRQLECVGV